MQKIATEFERLVEHWVLDDKDREAWREFFYHAAEGPPNTPSLTAPPLFLGQNEAGAVVEVRESGSGGSDVFVDGVHADHYDVPWQLHADRFAPILIGQWTCTETFQAPEAALTALDLFLARPDSEPPWRWGPALFEDGLIDANFGLTPRGVRRPSPSPAVPTSADDRQLIHYVVMLVNAGRARLFTLQADAFEPRTTFEPLVEVSDLSSGLARAMDSQYFSDSRPGLRREGPQGPRHAVDDRRQHHRRESQRKFVERIVKAAAKVWSQYRECQVVVVASPLMLTRLRPAISRCLNGTSAVVVHEYPHNLNWQEPAAIHGALAKAGLLPSRTRRPPLRPLRTPNPWQE